jgi:hypothetical protein
MIICPVGEVVALHHEGIRSPYQALTRASDRGQWAVWLASELRGALRPVYDCRHFAGDIQAIQMSSDTKPTMKANFQRRTDNEGRSHHGNISASASLAIFGVQEALAAKCNTGFLFNQTSSNVCDQELAFLFQIEASHLQAEETSTVSIIEPSVHVDISLSNNSPIIRP